jgi:DNA-binding MarR family transcriptional regulator
MVLNYFFPMNQNDKSVVSAGENGASIIDVIDELACTHSALRRAARQLGNLYDDAVAPTNLKATQIALLGQIERHGGTDGPALQLLADALAIGVSALTHALRPLVREGLVELRPDDHDGRTKHAKLTKAGRKRLHEGVTLWAAANRRTDTVLGADSARRLRTLANQVSSKDFFRAYTTGCARAKATLK